MPPRSAGARLGSLWICGLLAVGCGLGGSDYETARTITRAEVASLPPGNAVGSTFSGRYAATSGNLEACTCRRGRCAFTFFAGDLETVIQQDGVVTVDDSVGGVDTDGRFWLGLVIENASTTVYSLTNGEFRLATDTPTSYRAVTETTIVDSSAGVDCDGRFIFETRYLGL